MFTYDQKALQQLFTQILAKHVSHESLAFIIDPGDLCKAFVLLPRKTGRSPVVVTHAQIELLAMIRPNFNLDGWTADRLGRVLLLTQLDPSDREHYFKLIEALFLSGEMNELVALYSALPLLAYPEIWVKRCAEGIRSNIGIVLDAIMYHNPYPAEQLPDEAWNQLVMKAVFTEKRLSLIIGLKQRNNVELSRMLLDYADERTAAGRSVMPELLVLANSFTEK